MVFFFLLRREESLLNLNAFKEQFSILSFLKMQKISLGKTDFCITRRHRSVLMPLNSEQTSYLNDKYLWFSYQTSALVSSEHVCECLNFDLGIICINMIILTVAQDHTNKAVSITVVILRG